jgi:DNA polymerase-1
MRDFPFDRAAVTELFRELEFFSLLNKLPEVSTETPTEVFVAAAPLEADYRIVSSTPDLDDVASRISSAGYFAFDTETTGLDPQRANIVGISLAVEEGTAYYIPVGHTCLDAVTQLPLAQVVDRLKPIFEDPSIRKYGHNGKFDMNVMATQGVGTAGLEFDSMIAAHLGEKSLGLKPLASLRLNIEMLPITDLIGKGSSSWTMAQVDIASAAKYAAADADMTLRLTNLFRPELEKQDLLKLFGTWKYRLYGPMEMERCRYCRRYGLPGRDVRVLGNSSGNWNAVSTISSGMNLT